MSTAPFPMKPDYGWRRGPSQVPTAGDQVVVTDRDSEYYGHVGLLRADDPAWQTVTVGFSCVMVQFYRRDVRRVTTRDTLVVTNLERA